MSDAGKAEAGSVGWMDLTVSNAEEVREFYTQVVGWKPEPVPMDGYSDFSMNTAVGGQAVAGICHARGPNADLPAQWLIYVVVSDLEQSLERCRALGGEIVSGPRGDPASARFCVVRDPAGAVVALYQPSA